MKYLNWRLYKVLIAIVLIVAIFFTIITFSKRDNINIFDNYENVDVDISTLGDKVTHREKTGSFITLNDVELGTTINIKTKNSYVYAVGINWFPINTSNQENKLVINKEKKHTDDAVVRKIDIPVDYPAGDYYFSAVATTTDKDVPECSVALYDGDDLIVKSAINANVNREASVHLNAQKSFNKIVIFSSKGHSTELYNILLKYESIYANEYEEYCGEIYNPAQDKITVLSRPLYLFSTDGSEMQVEYTKGKIDLDNYYFSDNYLPNKIDTINTLVANAGENSDAFVFITDLHLEKNKNAKRYLPLLEYINKYTSVNRLIVGGDMFAGGTQSSLMQTAFEIEKVFSNGSVHYVMGNHEYDAGITDDILFDVYNRNKPEQIGNNERNYYYVDNKEKKMRYIVLNPYKLADDLSETVTGWDAEQKAWLDDVALDVEDGWGIIISIHYAWSNDWQREIQASIDGYRGKGEIIAVFNGHIHSDGIRYTAGGTPCISVACDKNNSEDDVLMKTERTVGTITEQAFDVVIVDRNVKKLYCVRIGAPALDGNGDISNKLVQIRTVNY